MGNSRSEVLQMHKELARVNVNFFTETMSREFRSGFAYQTIPV